MAAARSGSARPNASIVSQPSYLICFSAANVSFQCTCPVPGVPRSFSLMCTCTMLSAAPTIAWLMSFSSMLAWKVSYIMRQLGWLTCLTSVRQSTAVVTR